MRGESPEDGLGTLRLVPTSYALMKDITAHCGTSDTTWEAFRQYGIDENNGLPAAGKRKLRLPRGNKDGDKTRECLHHLLLDSLKKDRETETQGALESAALRTPAMAMLGKIH